MNELIQELLADPEKMEALDWLKSSTDKCEHTLGEMPPDESLKMIQEVYALGAAHVWAVEIDKDDDLEETGKLVLELPASNEERKQVFIWAANWAKRLGFDPEPDLGQSHLFVMLD